MEGEMLTTEETLFDRDEHEEIIPRVVPVFGTGVKYTKNEIESAKKEGKEIGIWKEKPKMIKIRPLCRAEILKMREESRGSETTKDQDVEIVKRNCIEPKYEDKHFEKGLVKSGWIEAIVLTITRYSGLLPSNKGEENDELKK